MSTPNFFARLSVGFAKNWARAPIDVVLGGLFVVQPGLALQVLGVPADDYAEALFSLFGAAFVFKGFVQHALCRSPEDSRRGFILANAVFEGLLAVLLGLVVLRGPAVSPAVTAAVLIFTTEFILDGWAFVRPA